MKPIQTNRLIKALFAYAALAALIAATGCSDSKSSNIVETDEMFASFRAVADGSGETEVIAALRTQDPAVIFTRNRFIEIEGRDRMNATFIDPITLSEVNVRMTEVKNGVETRYVATFAGDDKGFEYEIELNRSGTSKVSAPDSRVTLPSPFVFDWVENPVTLTPAPINFSRSSATSYFVIWDPFDAPDFEPGDDFRFRVTGSCIETFRGVIDWEGGEDVLELTGVLRDAPPPNDGMSCPLQVELTLQRRGTTDPAYDSGSFYGQQVRVLTLISSP